MKTFGNRKMFKNFIVVFLVSVILPCIVMTMFFSGGKNDLRTNAAYGGTGSLYAGYACGSLSPPRSTAADCGTVPSGYVCCGGTCSTTCSNPSGTYGNTLCLDSNTVGVCTCDGGWATAACASALICVGSACATPTPIDRSGTPCSGNLTDSCCYNLYCAASGAKSCQLAYANCVPLGGFCTATVNADGSCAVARDCVGSNITCNSPNHLRFASCSQGETVVGQTTQCATCTNVGYCCASVPTTDGVCGSTNGTYQSSTPASGLCSAGTASYVSTGGGAFSWTCNGINGGFDASCAAYASCGYYGGTCYAPYVGGQTACSYFNYTDASYSYTYAQTGFSAGAGCNGNSSNLCCIKSQTPLPACGTCGSSCNSYTISGSACITVNCPSTTSCTACQKCNQSNGSATAGSCVADATKDVTGAAGVCSGANGTSVCTAPSASCSTGTPSGVSGSGPWTWTCAGLAGTCAGATGATANCSASKTAAVNGDWGAWSACASCSRTQTCSTANSCGTQNCTPAGGTVTDNACGNVNGGWSLFGSCSVSCGDGTQSRTCTNPAPVCNGTLCPGSATQACNLGCCPVNGSNGVCGSANGVVTGTPPSANLCSVGANLGVTTGSGVYTWTCYGTAGSCGGLSGTNASCSAPSLQPPTYTSFDLRNNSGTSVPVEGGNLNQVCQTTFAGRLVRFAVVAADPNGLSDIASVQIRVGGQTYTNNYASNFSGTAIFDVTYPAVVTSTTTIIETNITDSTGLSTGWINVGRSLKIWDCKVPVSGTLYDGSKAVFEVINCGVGSSDFMTAVGSSMAYGLTYTGIALDTDKAMTVTSPNYSSGANSLYWGAQYRANFTNVNGNTPVMRYPGNNTCNNTNASFTVDNAGQLNVDPYAANPSVVLNFSSILSQFPWFQASGGGVVAKVSITDNIPNTCVSPCKPNVTLSSGTSAPNGLVAAQTITKGSGSFGETNNWSVNTNVIGSDYSYKYFYNEYFVKLGQGKTYNVGTTGSINLSQIVTDTGGTGVVLVNGSVAVNANNTVPTGTFFMLVASKDINVSSTVTNMQGIFITDNSFAVTGNSDNQLKIDGSIYSRNSVRLARGFTTGTLNNRNPAMVVNYRPDFIFSMPGKLTKILSGWKEGI